MPTHEEIDDDFDEDVILTEDKEDREYFNELYGDVVAVGSPDLHHRLHGARVAAGFIFTSDVARLLDMNESTYRHAEDGLRPGSQDLVDKAAELFGVDPVFLLTGEPVGEREAFAARITEIVKHEDFEEVEREDEYLQMLERLREMRSSAGYDNPKAAAEAFGWSRSTLYQHERGLRFVGLDRIVAYALALGFRPEWAAFGIGERMDRNPIEWREQDRLPRLGGDRPTLGM